MSIVQEFSNINADK